MTTPLNTTRHLPDLTAPVTPLRWRGTRPVPGPGSNTAGAGEVLPPFRTAPAGRSCDGRPVERAFGSGGRWWRFRRRARLVVESPGVVLLSGFGSLLLIAASPLLAGPVDGPAEQVAVVQSAPDDVPADAGAVSPAP